MKKNLIFIGMITLALVLTTGTFAFTYTSNSTSLDVSLAEGAWATYQPSVNQPDWDSLIPQSGSGSDILVPIGPGDATDILTQYPNTGEHWDKVDDQPSDESTTYVSTYGATGFQTDLYEIADLPSGAETVTGVTIYLRFASADSWQVQTMTEIITNGEPYSGVTESTSTTTWVTVSTYYEINPITEAPWTVDEVNALQAGLSIKGGNKTNKAAYCTQLYVQVDYEYTGTTEGEVPQGSLYNITPHAEYTGDMLVKIYLTNTANLLKAYQYLNMKVYVSNSVEAGGIPNYKVLSIENGVIEFTIIGGSANTYTVSVTGGSYCLISDNPDSWGTGWSITPEFYCEVTQR